ncbi:MAG: DNA (cytosine-5-)-methyltransferase [Firmicutes bacterium]|nr:DNA (cytosine-5-)-methyltransferase [Bacillota bacterium]
MKFNILDLFCGAGGFSAGLDNVTNMNTVMGVDFDKYAIETFQNNFKDADTICGDITDPKVKQEIIDKAKKRKVNMIVGGPPCQGFSLKGKNLGINDPRNFLFLEYFEVVKELQPEVFVIENVKNLLNSEKGFFLEQIKEKFSSIGYIINPGVLNAKNFGVPENRERAIIIGSKTRMIDLPIGNNKKTTVRDAISDLSYLESGEGDNESNYLFPPQSDYQKKLRGEKLYNHFATNHSVEALKKLAMIPPEGDKSYLPKELHGKQKFQTTWSRLEWDNISPTIDTRFDTPSNGRNSHPILNRSITPREAARIQSFSDNFIFYGTKSAICKQIGNAVPPFLAKAIGEAIQKAYTGKRITKENYDLYEANAYTIINELKQNQIKVNHIITDPPYNISQENNFNTLRNPRQGVDFGKWDKSFDLYSWIENYVELLDKNGSLIIFCSYRYISHIIDKIEKCGLCVKDVIIWKKSNPMPRNRDRRYVQDTEFAIWAVMKDAKWIFNKPEEKPYLRSTYETSTVSGKEKTNHPTQKSLKLMEEIIRVHTKPNDVILDPFMGSGSTGVAALKTNRKFIGIELEEEYFLIAKERLENIDN